MDIEDDDADPANAVVQISVGRSGSSLLAELVNHDNAFRYMFEPLHPSVPGSKALRAAYVPEGAEDPERRALAELILSGRLRHAWVDAHTPPGRYRRRLIKLIRGTRAAPWLMQTFPQPRYVVLLRNPFATAVSVMAAGWQPSGRMPSPAYGADFGIDADVFERFGGTPFGRAMLYWCIGNRALLSAAPRAGAHLVHYEDLFLRGEPVLRALFAFVGQRYAPAVLARLSRPSRSAAYSGRHRPGRRAHVRDDWAGELAPGELEQGMQILRSFRLAHLYDEDGRPTHAAG